MGGGSKMASTPVPLTHSTQPTDGAPLFWLPVFSILRREDTRRRDDETTRRRDDETTRRDGVSVTD
jgi:hypothetical protein